MIHSWGPGQLGSRLNKATPQINRMLADADQRARALLTPAQLRMVPAASGGKATPAPPPTGAGMPGAPKLPGGGEQR